MRTSVPADNGAVTPEPYTVVARNIDPAADNRIHDDDVAQRLGFSGALVPGVELFAYLTAPFVAAWGEPWLSGGALTVRFRRPVYDGERVVVRTRPAVGEGELHVVLEGPDGTERAVGTAAFPDRPGLVDLGHYPVTPLPSPLRAPRPDALVPGPFGTVTELCSAADNGAYCDAVGERLPVYEGGGVVHPGLLLRLVNTALMRNVALGPWIHTASACRMLGVARTPTALSVRSVVTELSQRNGHEYVRYDALVLSDDVPVLQCDHRAIYALAGAAELG